MAVRLGRWSPRVLDLIVDCCTMDVRAACGLQELGVDVLSMSIDSMFTHKMWNDHELAEG